MRIDIVKGHQVWQAWKAIWERIDQRPEEAAPPVAMQNQLETQRGLAAAPDRTNLQRDERRVPLAGPRTHPVHDPSWYTPGERRLWIPWAADAPSGARRGRYEGGYPSGLVLHWTAGHRNGLKPGNDLMRSTGMLYLLGDKDGNLAQSDPLSHWGYHAGQSAWPGVDGTVSNEFIGLELQCWGKLKSIEPFRSWAGYEVPAEEVKRTTRKRSNIEPGYYHIFTDAQVNLARRTCLWLHLNWPQKFDLQNVVGHDEVSPGRKADPGGSIWLPDSEEALTMQDFRDLLQEDLAQIKSAMRRKA